MPGTHNKSVREISYILLEELVKKKKQFIKEKNEQDPMLNSGPHFKFKICLSKKMSFSACQASIGYKMGILYTIGEIIQQFFSIS